MKTIPLQPVLLPGISMGLALYMGLALGIVLALNAPDGELMQLYQLALDEYDTQLLCSVIANFAEKAATWRKLLAAGGINLDDAGVVPSDTLPLNPDTAIRV